MPQKRTRASAAAVASPPTTRRSSSPRGRSNAQLSDAMVPYVSPSERVNLLTQMAVSLPAIPSLSKSADRVARNDVDRLRAEMKRKMEELMEEAALKMNAINEHADTDLKERYQVGYLMSKFPDLYVQRVTLRIALCDDEDNSRLISDVQKVYLLVATRTDREFHEMLDCDMSRPSSDYGFIDLAQELFDIARRAGKLDALGPVPDGSYRRLFGAVMTDYKTDPVLFGTSGIRGVRLLPDAETNEEEVLWPAPVFGGLFSYLSKSLVPRSEFFKVRSSSVVDALIIKDNVNYDEDYTSESEPKLYSHYLNTSYSVVSESDAPSSASRSRALRD
jgi:hypothetical protein